MMWSRSERNFGGMLQRSSDCSYHWIPLGFFHISWDGWEGPRPPQPHSVSLCLGPELFSTKCCLSPSPPATSQLPPDSLHPSLPKPVAKGRILDSPALLHPQIVGGSCALVPVPGVKTSGATSIHFTINCCCLSAIIAIFCALWASSPRCVPAELWQTIPYKMQQPGSEGLSLFLHSLEF